MEHPIEHALELGFAVLLVLLAISSFFRMQGSLEAYNNQVEMRAETAQATSALSFNDASKVTGENALTMEGVQLAMFFCQLSESTKVTFVQNGTGKMIDVWLLLENAEGIADKMTRLKNEGFLIGKTYKETTILDGNKQVIERRYTQNDVEGDNHD